MAIVPSDRAQWNRARLAFVVLIVIGALVLGGLAYFLGRRRGGRNDEPLELEE